MKVSAIDPERIQSMLAQMKVAAQKPDIGNVVNTKAIAAPASTKVDFSQALKASLDQVNQTQVNAETLGKNFVMGDDSVSLSDVMISGQKANIAFQATVQVRNKLVSAYQDIMNMQV